MFTLVRVHTLYCAVCSVQCAVCSVQCAGCSVQCAVCETLDWPAGFWWIDQGALGHHSSSPTPPLFSVISNTIHCTCVICVWRFYYMQINYFLDIPHIYVHMWTIALMSVYIATPPPSPWYLLFQFLPCIFLFEYNHKCTLYKNDWNMRQFQQNLCSNASV